MTDGLTIFMVLSTFAFLTYATFLWLLLIVQYIRLAHSILMMLDFLVIIIKFIWWKRLAWVFLQYHFNWLLMLILLKQILLLELTLLQYLALRLSFANTGRVIL